MRKLSSSRNRQSLRNAEGIFHPHAESRGIALVLVLAVLVIVSILVIGMLTSARVNLATAQSYSSGNDVQLLSDTAVNLAIAQIRKGTSNEDLAWISQPGLIRTFSPTGQVQAYKLYSSYSMVEDRDYDPGAASVLSQEVPNDWFSRTEEFVDLNRPVDLDGEQVYPIVDPAQAGFVEGFSFDATGRLAPNGTLEENPLPMPVRWIYVGKDGEFMTASDSNRSQAVARLAFWTDDDSSKININTAAGGIFFDTPAVNTAEDHWLGRTQPIAQEYQRWPGHPSTTSLRPVLESLNVLSDPVTLARSVSSLTPRIGWGGSEGGQEYAWLTRSVGRTDMDRLFASLDEFYYGLSLNGNGDRLPFELSPGLTLEGTDQKVPQLGFFLTANSRSPELNLFNRPRVSLWPFNRELVDTADGSLLTPEDRLIRLATEFGGSAGNGILDYGKRKRFYFQRENAWDPFADYTNVPENQALVEYLRTMTSRPIPSARVARGGGATGSFKDKFGQADTDQLLVSMWDVIRSQINSVNQAYQPVGLPAYSFPQGHDTQTSGYNDVAPLIIDANGIKAKGLGRAAVPTEMILQFYCAGEDFERGSDDKPIDQHNNADPSNPAPDGIPDFVVRKVRIVLLINFQLPVDHLYTSNPRFQLEVTGNPFNIETNSPGISGQPAVLVRNPTSGNTTWSTSLGSDGVGFPGSSGTNRTICYVDGFGLGANSSRGGSAGICTRCMRRSRTLPRQTTRYLEQTPTHSKSSPTAPEAR